MSISTQRFIQNPVDAIQITEENIHQIAMWSQGEVFQSLEQFPKKYIALTVDHPTGRRSAKAFAGDWIVTVKGRFKVYNDRAFKSTFKPAPTEASIMMLVGDAMAKATVVDSSAYNEATKIRKLGEVESDAVNRIMDLL